MVLALRRTQVYSVKQFMEMTRAKETMNDVLKTVKKRKPYGMIPLALAPLLKTTSVFAQAAVPVAANAALFTKVSTAFAPLVGLIQAIAYPIALVVVLGGALCVMIGDRAKGFSMMQGAGLGYVLVQMSPLILNVLVGAMGAM